MSVRGRVREARLEIRLTEQEKQLLRQAANDRGTTVAEFVRETLLMRARGDDEWARSMVLDALTEALAE